LSLIPRRITSSTRDPGTVNLLVALAGLFTLAILVSIGLRLVILRLGDRGLLDMGTAMLLDDVATAAALVLLVLVIGRRIHRLNAARQLVRVELIESELRFRDMFDDAPTGYHELDAQGRIIRVNRTELATLGYSAEEVLGRHVWEFLEDPDASRTAVLQKLAGPPPPPGSFERVYVRKDGTRVPVLLQDRIIRDHEGSITGIRTTVQDITAFKQMDAERERLITELQKTLGEIRILKGFIPICASCKKIRDDHGYWDQVESYLTRHTDASFSHGICPDCANRLYPELSRRQTPESREEQSI